MRYQGDDKKVTGAHFFPKHENVAPVHTPLRFLKKSCCGPHAVNSFVSSVLFIFRKHDSRLCAVKNSISAKNTKNRECVLNQRKTNDFACVLCEFESDRRHFFLFRGFVVSLRCVRLRCGCGCRWVAFSFLVPPLRCPEVGLGIVFWLQNSKS